MSATILLKTDSKTPNRDQLFAAYKYVVNNWAVETAEVAEGLGTSVAYAKQLLGYLGGLVEGTHVNGEKPITWQSYFDIENEANVPANSTKAFNKVFPKGVEVEFNAAPKTNGRKGATGPRYTPAQIKKGLAARKAGKRNREVAEAAGVKSPAYFSKVLKALEAASAPMTESRKPRRVVRRSTKAGA